MGPYKLIEKGVSHDNSVMTTSFAPDAAPPPVTDVDHQLAMSGVVQLSHLGVIRAVGEEAAKFLQGQLTQDIAGLRQDRACLAAFCNAKGRMQASFVVFKRSSDDILLVCSRDLLPQTVKRLSMFVMRAKVKLSDASDAFLLYGAAGAAATALGAINSEAASAYIHWAQNDFDEQTTIQLYPGAGIDRVMWCAPTGTTPPAGPSLSLSNWQWLEVQAGIAMVTLPIFEAFVPQMLNYESIGGVNFKKGCYPGQEVVARSQFRGTLKRRAYVAHMRGAPGNDPQVGQEVYHGSDAEQPCGLVAASAADPAGGFAVILSMQTSAAAGLLTLGSSGGAALTLLPLPYPLLEDI
jgi:folate-binding protein YgfZ